MWTTGILESPFKSGTIYKIKISEVIVSNPRAAAAEELGKVREVAEKGVRRVEEGVRRAEEGVEEGARRAEERMRRAMQSQRKSSPDTDCLGRETKEVVEAIAGCEVVLAGQGKDPAQ